MSKKPKVIDKDRFDAAMILASYYSSWGESINQGEFRKKHGVYPEGMVEKYRTGQAKASQVIKPIQDAIRTDTQEGKDATGFFNDLAVAADMLENPQKVGEKVARKRKAKGSPKKSG